MTTIKTCRSCGAGDLVPVLSLGDMPLANALVAEADLGKPEAKYPLDLVFCAGCTLAQITEEVPPETMFSEYLYFSSLSETMVKHAETLATRLVKERKLGKKSLVVEVASNDGYLLQHYKEAGVPVLGVEPAKNVAKVAETKGVRTLVRFFGTDVAKELVEKGERADVIHAHNVLAHVPDLNGVVAGFASVLKDDGVVVVECPWVKDLVDNCEFDTIYHEHLSYFSLHALDALFARHELVIQDVEKLPIHGGSMRVFASKKGKKSKSVKDMLAEEKKAGVDTKAYYEGFSTRVKALRAELVAMLEVLSEQGARVAAYGAAAKGATLSNYIGMTKGNVPYVVDRSTHKQGRFMPGTRQQILAPTALLDKMPDFVILLTWNLEEEILEQQKAYRDRGGKFVIPIPSVRIV